MWSTYIFHLFHYTINIIKKGANVLQNVSKIYLVYKNESGLSSVEAAAAAAATEAWWAAILSLRSECNLFKFSIWLAPPEIISGIINYRKEQTNVMAYLLPIHNRVSDMSNNRATNFIIFQEKTPPYTFIRSFVTVSFLSLRTKVNSYVLKLVNRICHHITITFLPFRSRRTPL